MDLSSRRKLWLLNLVVVALCVAFGVRTLAQGFEPRQIPHDALASLAPPPRAEAAPAPVEAPPAPEPKKVEAPPPEPEPVVAPAPAPEPIAPPPLTSLPLSLLATSVATPADYSSALVLDSSQRSSTYWPGDLLPGAGPIVAIAPRYVDFINSTGHTERLDLVAKAEAPRPVVGDVTPGLPAVPKTELTEQMDKSIQQVDATHYKIDRAFVNNVLANPAVLIGTLRAKPIPSQPGVPGGLKLGGVKPGSAAERIGLKNGDTITVINGNDMGNGDFDKMFELFTKLKSARSLSVQVLRGGKPVSIDYSIQ